MKIRHIRSTDTWLLSKGKRVLYRGKQNPWHSQKVIATAFIAGPFLVAGGLGLNEAEMPTWASGVFLIVGMLMAALALISIGRVIPPLSLAEGEQLLVSRHPTMKPAFARFVHSLRNCFE